MDSYGKGLPLCQIESPCLFLTLSQELAVTVRRSRATFVHEQRGRQQGLFHIRGYCCLEFGRNIRSIGSFGRIQQGASFSVYLPLRSSSLAARPPLALRQPFSFQAVCSRISNKAHQFAPSVPDGKTATRFRRRCAGRYWA